MKQEKQRISSLRQSPWFPLVGYGAILLAFCLFCTRLFFKTDDGNFTGILLSPDFSLYGFLSQRYLTWSGRTVGEALLMLFLRAPLVCWKLVNFGLLFYISYFLCRLFTWAEGPLPARERILFGSASLWMIFFLSLNSPAFWFSATFFYVWPAAAMLYTLSPLVALLFGQKVRWRCLPLWCLAAVLAASQEQSCALTLTFFLLLLAALWMREKHFRPIFLLQLLILAAETAWVLLSTAFALTKAVRRIGEPLGAPIFLYPIDCYSSARLFKHCRPPACPEKMAENFACCAQWRSVLPLRALQYPPSCNARWFSMAQRGLRRARFRLGRLPGACARFAVPARGSCAQPVFVAQAAGCCPCGSWGRRTSSRSAPRRATRT